MFPAGIIKQCCYCITRENFLECFLSLNLKITKGNLPTISIKFIRGWAIEILIQSTRFPITIIHSATPRFYFHLQVFCNCFTFTCSKWCVIAFSWKICTIVIEQPLAYLIVKNRSHYCNFDIYLHYYTLLWCISRFENSSG